MGDASHDKGTKRALHSCIVKLVVVVDRSMRSAASGTGVKKEEWDFSRGRKGGTR